MELVATSDQQLRYLGRQEPHLAPHFAGVFASDLLPKRPVRDRPQGYIVNLDTRDEPGTHWIAVWTTPKDECWVMDSFGMPLHRYEPPNFWDWLTTHYERFEMNQYAFQTIDSQACGLYALMFLVHCSVGGNLDTFSAIFSRHDYVKNDMRVAQWFERLISEDEGRWQKFKGRQQNDQPVRYMEMMEIN